jgi:hypothetical protein
MNPVILGRWIAGQRRRAGLSRSALAKEALIGRGVLDRIEKGEHRTPATPVLIDCVLRALGLNKEAEMGLLDASELCPSCGTYVGTFTLAEDAASAGEWLARLNDLDPDDPKMPFKAAVGKNLVEHARALQIGTRALAVLIDVWFNADVPPSSIRSDGIYFDDPLAVQIDEALEALNDARHALEACRPRRWYVKPAPGSLDALLEKVRPRRAPLYQIHRRGLEP